MSQVLFISPSYTMQIHTHKHTGTYNTLADLETGANASTHTDNPRSELMHVNIYMDAHAFAYTHTSRRITMGARHFPIISHQLNTPP